MAALKVHAPSALAALFFLNPAFYSVGPVDATIFNLELDASGLFLTMNFNQTSGSPTCDSILDPELLISLSSPYGIPSCIWYSDDEFRIYPPFGSNYTLPTSSSLSSPEYSPYLILEAPSMVNPCSDLTLSVASTLSK